MESYKTNFEQTTKNIFKGIAIAMITTVILLLIFSVILAYTNTSESTITPVIIVVTGISILLRKFNWKHKNKKERNYKWSFNRWNLHINTLFNLKYIELEIWIKSSKHNYDISRNDIWNYRRNYRSKQKIEDVSQNGQNVQKETSKIGHFVQKETSPVGHFFVVANKYGINGQNNIKNWKKQLIFSLF